MASGNFSAEEHPHQHFNCCCGACGPIIQSMIIMIQFLLEEPNSSTKEVLNSKLNQMLSQLQNSARPPTMSMLPNQAQPSATRCLKLQFKGDVPDTLYTMTKLEEQHGILEVELLDEFGKRVDSGPESSLKIKIDVLDGDFDAEDRNDLTEEEYTKNITCPRKRKGAPLLQGNCEIKMSRGVATVSHIKFTDNSKSIRSEKYRLGAKVVKGLPPGVVVMAAVSGAIRVKERRCLKSTKIRNAKQNELPQINTSTYQISDQELTNLPIIQRQPAAAAPPPSSDPSVGCLVQNMDASISSDQLYNNLLMQYSDIAETYQDDFWRNMEISTELPARLTACISGDNNPSVAVNIPVQISDHRLHLPTSLPPERCSASYPCPNIPGMLQNMGASISSDQLYSDLPMQYSDSAETYQDDLWQNLDFSTESSACLMTSVSGDYNPSVAVNVPVQMSDHRLDKSTSLSPEKSPASYFCNNISGMQQMDYFASLSTNSSGSIDDKFIADLLSGSEANDEDLQPLSIPDELRNKTSSSRHWVKWRRIRVQLTFLVRLRRIDDYRPLKKQKT